jgi:hypothetical protein
MGRRRTGCPVPESPIGGEASQYDRQTGRLAGIRQAAWQAVVGPGVGTTPADEGGGDHPVYIQAMHEFFTAHADDIAYETRHPGFQLWPSTLCPGSANEDRERF